MNAEGRGTFQEMLRARRRMLTQVSAGLLLLITLSMVLIAVTRVAAVVLFPLSIGWCLTALALFGFWRGSFQWLRSAVMPLLAVLTAVVVGGLIVLVTDQAVFQSFAEEGVGAGLQAAWRSVYTAYATMFEGAIGSPARIIAGLQTWGSEGDIRPLLSALRPLSESLVNAVPYIFAGLAVALGFRAGLFNIGAEGQYILGGLIAAWAGFAIHGLPAWVHLPLCLVLAAVGSGIWAAIPGLLKAKTGAHEVITTIMMNYVAFKLTDWLLNGPFEAIQGTARTPDILESAYLPRFFPHPIRIHAGFPLALLIAWGGYLFLWKTTWGFELRTVGANPDAARYGGMNITKTFVLAMFLSGALAGLGGAVQSLAITHNMSMGFSAGYGFDSIALALLGGSHPLGVVLAALLFGTLRAGGTRMQSVAGIPIEIISIVQAMVIIFIAAPAIIRAIFRIREGRDVQPAFFSRGWGT